MSDQCAFSFVKSKELLPRKAILELVELEEFT